MPKRFDVGVDQFQASAFTDPVRTKRDVILLWMNAIKTFLAQQPPTAAQEMARLSIVVDKMSRLFCELSGGEKIFSLAFPFTAQSIDGEINFSSRDGVLIDNRVSSAIVALIEGGRVLEESDFSRFIDPLIEATDIDQSVWSLFRELMLAEDAYVRYDWDETRANGHLHPLHHLDFYYSSSGTFKVGLPSGLDHAALMSILDVNVDCHYLHPPPSV